MELLQAGVDCSVIALWLGHELIETTQIYLHAHLDFTWAILRHNEFNKTCCRCERQAASRSTICWMALSAR